MADTYKALAQKDAVNQRFYLAIVDENGVAHPEFGQVAIALGDIRAILAATTATPVDVTIPAPVLKVVETLYYDQNCNPVYRLEIAGGFYTKA